jgi:hypothetical protein
MAGSTSAGIHLLAQHSGEGFEAHDPEILSRA